MLLNKGNLHWKFLQEHRPFHVSQPGSSAFIPGLLLLLSLFLCPQCILSGSYTSACPQCLSAYSASKLSQKRLCSHILSPNSGTHLSDIWSSRKVHFFKAFSLEKTHTENSEADSAFLLELSGTSSWLHSRNPAAPLLWERKAMGQAEKSNISPSDEAK